MCGRRRFQGGEGAKVELNAEQQQSCFSGVLLLLDFNLLAACSRQYRMN